MALFIYDWDDTLFPTTWLYEEAFQSPITFEQHEWFNICAAHIKGILTVSMIYGRVLIITNASPGWISYCVKRFIPACRPIIERCEIHYAWNAYEPDYTLWKKHYLMSYVESTLPIKCVLGIGDRSHDREAVRTAFLGKCIVKTIQLMHEPPVIQVVLQLKMLMDGFGQLMNAGYLDLQTCQLVA